MRRILTAGMLMAAVVLVAGCDMGPREDASFRDTFAVTKAQLSSSGTGKYFILEPGTRLTYTHAVDTLTITVLNETKLVDGVQTRVVEEHETEGGKLVEISRNYFAIDKATGDVYYFGEDVDIYKDGKVTAHDGSWASGVNGARFGMMIPGAPKVGDRFQQEVAPQAAMDRVEITSVTETVKTPAGEFKNCVVTKETSPLEAGSSSKTYAPGVGLVVDDEFVLSKVERAGR